ncbi:hypothetical protein GUJ93_ZPchr0009g1106 [Zizania palustris]|uniref:Uncharacterized protein n=1 Tax=Zizania palustris TaxID=103762 RepID=A0A8J5RIX0_ZIZPA|nr:hypothetical protein GUJ93_ZPchr0009g1106 [Zizania palustris]
MSSLLSQDIVFRCLSDLLCMLPLMTSDFIYYCLCLVTRLLLHYSVLPEFCGLDVRSNACLLENTETTPGGHRNCSKHHAFVSGQRSAFAPKQFCLRHFLRAISFCLFPLCLVDKCYF